MKILKPAIFSGLIPLLLLSSCATIVNGTKQTIQISSYPTNAAVWIDGICCGETPLIAKLDRKDEHALRLELTGYEPYQIILRKSLSGWVFGNIVFGGFVGLGVDFITGAVYKLTPDQVHAHMAQNNICCSKKGDKSYIAVVLKPDHSWEKIGQLKKIN